VPSMVHRGVSPILPHQHHNDWHNVQLGISLMPLVVLSTLRHTTVEWGWQWWGFGVAVVQSNHWPLVTAEYCLVVQVLWQPGWTSQCAKTLGEEGEQFFSYWSKYAFTTRNQSVAGVHMGWRHAHRLTYCNGSYCGVVYYVSVRDRGCKQFISWVVHPGSHADLCCGSRASLAMLDDTPGLGPPYLCTHLWYTLWILYCPGSDDQLTKGAFHFGRLKVQRQAAMLVERYRKFTALLPKAEAKLAEQLLLLVHTAAEMRPALISSMREALRALAQGGCLVEQHRGAEILRRNGRSDTS